MPESRQAYHRAGHLAGHAMTDGSRGSGVDWESKRSDARRNHEKVLIAAAEVFTEKGLDATMPEVAERAGVGKATVYRSFPTKADLVAALAATHVAWIRAKTDEAAAHPDPMIALGTLLDDVVVRLASNRLMIDILTSDDRFLATAQNAVTDGADAQHVKNDDVTATFTVMSALLARARDTGALRRDVTPVDLHVLIGGAARVLVSLGVDDPQVWRRYARLVLRAIRADPATPPIRTGTEVVKRMRTTM